MEQERAKNQKAIKQDKTEGTPEQCLRQLQQKPHLH